MLKPMPSLRSWCRSLSRTLFERIFLGSVVLRMWLEYGLVTNYCLGSFKYNNEEKVILFNETIIN